MGQSLRVLIACMAPLPSGFGGRREEITGNDVAFRIQMKADGSFK